MAYVRYAGEKNVYDTSSGKIVTYAEAQAKNLFAPGKIQDVQGANPYAAKPVTKESFSGAQLTPYELSQINPKGTGAIPPSDLGNEPEFKLQPTKYETEASGLIEQTKKLYEQLVGKSSYQTEQETKYGIPGLESTITDLTSKLQGISNEAAAIPVQEQQRAAQGTVLTAGLQADQNQKIRENAIQALGVSTLLAAAQGNLTTAQRLADRAVGAKYDPILEQIEVNKNNLDLILNDPMATLAEKNRAEAQKEAQDAKAAEVQAQKDDAKAIWSIATGAAANGNNFTPSGIYGSLSQTLTAISEATTKEEALAIAVSTGLTQKKETGGSGITKLSPEKKTVLLGAGFTDADIDNIENDINTAGIDQVLADPNLTSSQKRAIQEVYGGGGVTLDRANLSKFFGISDDDERTGFLGFFGQGKTNREKLDELEASIERYRAVGYDDEDILKMMQ